MNSETGFYEKFKRAISCIGSGGWQISNLFGAAIPGFTILSFKYCLRGKLNTVNELIFHPRNNKILLTGRGNELDSIWQYQFQRNHPDSKNSFDDSINKVIEPTWQFCFQVGFYNPHH